MKKVYTFFLPGYLKAQLRVRALGLQGSADLWFLFACIRFLQGFLGSRVSST